MSTAWQMLSLEHKATASSSELRCRQQLKTILSGKSAYSKFIVKGHIEMYQGSMKYCHGCKNHRHGIVEKHLAPEGSTCWPRTRSHHVHKKSETGNLLCE